MNSQKNTVLVTGGAGYIGSHVVKQLLTSGESVVVLDDLSNGSAEALPDGLLHTGSVADADLVTRLLNEYHVDTIMHFAAAAIVSESVEQPQKYYLNNTAGTASLLNCAVDAGVQHFVFSSTAAVYGIPATGTCTEDSETKPINPYGSSKLMSETMLRDISQASAMRHVILRYFNVAGADPEGNIGQRGRTATHITKIACEVATKQRAELSIFGTDYNTPDGTCIRDYIHVEDLATAHLNARDYLLSGGESVTLNCGYGHGYSVREVVEAVERAAGEKLPTRNTERRSGDPPILIAATDRIAEVLNWSPQYDDLDVIAKTALDWERKLAATTTST